MLPGSPAFSVHTSCIAQVRESHHPEQTGILTFSASIQTAEHGEVKNTCVSWLRSRESYPSMLRWTLHAHWLFSCHFPGWLNPSLRPDCFIHPLAPLTLFFSIDKFVLRVFKEIVTDEFSHFFFTTLAKSLKRQSPPVKSQSWRNVKGLKGTWYKKHRALCCRQWPRGGAHSGYCKEKKNSANTRGGIGGKWRCLGLEQKHRKWDNWVNLRKVLLQTMDIGWSCTGNQLEIDMLTQKQVTNRSRRCC